MQMLKSVFAAAAAFAALTLSAAEVINLASSDVVRNAWGTPLKFEENQITTKGRAFIVMKKTIDIDHAKKYSFKVTAVGNKVKPTAIYIGFDPLNEKGVSIPAIQLQGLQYTFTQLARDAKKGDTVIYVKNGQAWVRGGSVVFVKDAKADNSDVPNSKVVGGNIVSVKKEGAEWAVTFKNALKEDLAAGTAVREHINGGFYYCAVKTVPQDGEIVLSGTVSGLPKYLQQYNGKNWPIGAKKASFIILADWTNTKTPVILKDATFTIE